MLRKERKGAYRFSEKVENELKKLGVLITPDPWCHDHRQYVDENLEVYVYSSPDYPTISMQVWLNEYNPDPKGFSKRIAENERLALKIFEIVMQDYL